MSERIYPYYVSWRCWGGFQHFEKGFRGYGSALDFFEEKLADKDVRTVALERVKMPSEREQPPACDLPPEGWWCSRSKGHEGPCAARPKDGGK